MKEKQILNGKIVVNIFLAILIFLVGAVFVYINLVQYKLGLNADIAGECLLAKVMWESKEWIPKDWYFGNELRLISATNCAALFYGVSKSLCFSMGMGCVVAGAFIIWGAYYLCKELDFSVTQKLLFILLIMMLPNNKAQMELLFIYASYYAVHIGVYFVTLAIYLKMIKKKEVSKAIIVVIFLLHLLLGMQGVRGLLIVTGPLMAVEILRRIYMWWSINELKNGNNAITGFVILLNVLEYLGGKFPKSIGYPLSRNIRKAPQKLFKIVLPDFLNTFEWNKISVVEKIALIMCLAVLLYLVISVWSQGIKKKSIVEENWVFLNFFISVLLTIAALTFTTVDSSSRYFVVVYFAIAMSLVMVLGKENKFIKSVMIFVIAVLFVGNCCRTYYPMLTDKSYENNVCVQVGEYLLQGGYENAYSDFEKANTLTLYNDGKIQISAVNSFSDMEVCKWLTSSKWYVPNVSKNSKTAYVVPEYCVEEMEEFLEEHIDVELKTKIGIYHIYDSNYNYSKLVD